MSRVSQKWWGLFALIPSLAMLFVDQTILPVAVPTIQQHLNASDVALEWAINGYLLAIAVLVLAGGKIGDWIGHRKTFLWGMALFAAASALCGLSGNIFELIGGRVLQGIGAALMIPSSTALLVPLFPPSERGKAMGINVSISSLFLILGPLLGGYFVQHLSWRWIFWVNLPIALGGVFLVLKFLPASPRGQAKIDLPGFVFFTISSSCLVAAIMQGREWGWSSAPILGLLGAALLSAIFLIRREKKAEHPFMDLSLFKHPVFRAVNISLFAVPFILMITFTRSIFLQSDLGWSPMKTGFVTFLSTTPILFVSPIGGLLSDRFSPKLPIAIGFFCLIFSFFWVPLTIHGPLWMVFLGFLAMGIGIPFIMTPSYASASGAVPPKKIGIAYGMIGTVRSLGSCLGVAVIGSLVDNIQFATLRKLLPGSAAELRHLLFGSSLPQGTLEAVQQARYEGFFYTHIILGLILAISFFFVFVLYNRKSTHHLPEAPAEGWD